MKIGTTWHNLRSIAPRLRSIIRFFNEQRPVYGQQEGVIMKQVQSADGTTIAYDQMGNGSAVILVDGALGSQAEGFMAPLATRLSPHFTVFTYDRRGRGESTDTQPFALEREIEDIEALINEAGG